MVINTYCFLDMKKERKHHSIRRSMLLFVVMMLMPVCYGQQKSKWVYPLSTGKLGYLTTKQGDRIMDFSHAGYEGGGVALPHVPTMKIVSARAGVEDYTAIIQQAIDEVSSLPLKDGFRGAVQLAAGEYPCKESLQINTDGVVLCGTIINGEKKSILRMYGEKHTAVILRSASRQRLEQLAESAVKVTDSYLPFGTYTLHVTDASSFKPDDVVLISKPVTRKWVEYMQMDDMWRNGKHQTWIAEGALLTTERTVKEVDRNTLILKEPIADSYDMRFTNDETKVCHVTSRWLRHAGVEHLVIVSPEQAVSHTVAKYYGLRISGEDCWADDIDLYETMESVGVTGKRITLRNVNVIRHAMHQGSSKPAEFAPNGTQVLLDRCSVKGDNIWFVGVGARVMGPIVMLNCRFLGNGRVEGHQRWSTAFLFDNCELPDGGIDFINRGEMGSGHGWGTAWAVAWNCKAKILVNQNPPGTLNWMIGCTGERRQQRRPFSKEGPVILEGEIDCHGEHVTPQCLYLTQLEERLGGEAVRAIGY